MTKKRRKNWDKSGNLMSVLPRKSAAEADLSTAYQTTLIQLDNKKKDKSHLGERNCFFLGVTETLSHSGEYNPV